VANARKADSITTFAYVPNIFKRGGAQAAARGASQYQAAFSKKRMGDDFSL
jgi:hypothetical protein